MEKSIEAKRKAMDAISCKETAIHRTLFRGGKADAAMGGPVASTPVSPPGLSVVGELRRQAMSAIKGVETIAQIGAVKLTGGIALYVAHIRQMDRQTGPKKQPSRIRIERLGRE